MRFASLSLLVMVSVTSSTTWALPPNRNANLVGCVANVFTSAGQDPYILGIANRAAAAFRSSPMNSDSSPAALTLPGVAGTDRASIEQMRRDGLSPLNALGRQVTEMATRPGGAGVSGVDETLALSMLLESEKSAMAASMSVACLGVDNCEAKLRRLVLATYRRDGSVGTINEAPWNNENGRGLVASYAHHYFRSEMIREINEAALNAAVASTSADPAARLNARQRGNQLGSRACPQGAPDFAHDAPPRGLRTAAAVLGSAANEPGNLTSRESSRVATDRAQRERAAQARAQAAQRRREEEIANSNPLPWMRPSNTIRSDFRDRDLYQCLTNRDQGAPQFPAVCRNRTTNVATFENLLSGSACHWSRCVDGVRQPVEPGQIPPVPNGTAASSALIEARNDANRVFRQKLLDTMFDEYTKGLFDSLDAATCERINSGRESAEQLVKADFINSSRTGTMGASESISDAEMASCSAKFHVSRDGVKNRINAAARAAREYCSNSSNYSRTLASNGCGDRQASCNALGARRMEFLMAAKALGHLNYQLKSMVQGRTVENGEFRAHGVQVPFPRSHADPESGRGSSMFERYQMVTLDFPISITSGFVGDRDGKTLPERLSGCFNGFDREHRPTWRRGDSDFHCEDFRNLSQGRTTNGNPESGADRANWNKYLSMILGHFAHAQREIRDAYPGASTLASFMGNNHSRRETSGQSGRGTEQTGSSHKQACVNNLINAYRTNNQMFCSANGQDGVAQGECTPEALAAVNSEITRSLGEHRRGNLGLAKQVCATGDGEADCLFKNALAYQPQNLTRIFRNETANRGHLLLGACFELNSRNESCDPNLVAGLATMAGLIGLGAVTGGMGPAVAIGVGLIGASADMYFNTQDITAERREAAIATSFYGACFANSGNLDNARNNLANAQSVYNANLVLSMADLGGTAFHALNALTDAATRGGGMVDNLAERTRRLHAERDRLRGESAVANATGGTPAAGAVTPPATVERAAAGAPTTTAANAAPATTTAARVRPLARNQMPTTVPSSMRGNPALRQAMGDALDAMGGNSATNRRLLGEAFRDVLARDVPPGSGVRRALGMGDDVTLSPEELGLLAEIRVHSKRLGGETWEADMYSRIRNAACSACPGLCPATPGARGASLLLPGDTTRTLASCALRK